MREENNLSFYSSLIIQMIFVILLFVGFQISGFPSALMFFSPKRVTAVAPTTQLIHFFLFLSTLSNINFILDTELLGIFLEKKEHVFLLVKKCDALFPKPENCFSHNTK